MRRLTITATALTLVFVLNQQPADAQNRETETADNDFDPIHEANREFFQAFPRTSPGGAAKRSEAVEKKVRNGLDWLVASLFDQVEVVNEGDFSGAEPFFVVTLNGVRKRIPITAEDVLKAYTASQMNRVRELVNEQWSELEKLYASLNESWARTKELTTAAQSNEAEAEASKSLVYDEFREEEQSTLDYFKEVAQRLEQEELADSELNSIVDQISERKDLLELARENAEQKATEFDGNLAQKRSEYGALAEQIRQQNEQSREFNRTIEEITKPIKEMDAQFRERREQLRNWAPDFEKRVRQHSGMNGSE